MKLVENVHYAVVEFRLWEWHLVDGLSGKFAFCFSDSDGCVKLAYITDPDICREDVKRHFEKIARERKATARNRKSVAIRRGKE